MPVFVLRSERSKIAVPVVSEPVPAVVGTHTRGFSFFRTGIPLPSGAFTKSMKSASGYDVYKFTYKWFISDGTDNAPIHQILHTSLAVSMTDPPPTANSASNSPIFLAKSIAF